jgi:hypothetical protein
MHPPAFPGHFTGVSAGCQGAHCCVLSMVYARGWCWLVAECHGPLSRGGSLCTCKDGVSSVGITCLGWGRTLENQVQEMFCGARMLGREAGERRGSWGSSSSVPSDPLLAACPSQGHWAPSLCLFRWAIPEVGPRVREVWGHIWLFAAAL